MNEDFVTYEIALKLKAKGYPQVKENTLAMYNEDGEWFSLAKNLDDFEYSFEDFDDRDCVCPTILQVLKWLRKKKIVVSILPAEYNKETGLSCYYYVIYDVAEYFWKKNEYPQSFETWEECAISSVEYILDNLI